MALMVIYYGFNDGKFHGFSPKILWEFSVPSQPSHGSSDPSRPFGELLKRFSRRTASYHDHCPAPHVAWKVGEVVVVVGLMRVSSGKKAAKKPGALYGKLRFSRDETLFGYKTKMVLLSRILFWKTNMFKNGWRLAITDFVRTGGFLWDWVDSSFCWISLMI